MKEKKSYEALLKELEELEFRLEEANDTIDAIRSGNIDGLIVNGEDGHQLYTLKSADHTYRIFIEQMNEGAVTLNHNGIVSYCNSRFASMVGLRMEKLVGQSFSSFVPPGFEKKWNNIFAAAWEKDIKDEMILCGSSVPVEVLISLKTLTLNDGVSMSIVITDLTEQKLSQKLLLRKNIELQKAHSVAQHLSVTLEKTVLERTRELKQRTEELEVNIKQKSIVEAMLRSNEERLIRILETMAEGVVIYDEDSNITFANVTAQKILGLEKGENNFLVMPEREIVKVDGSKLQPAAYPVALTWSTGLQMFDYEIGLVQPGKETLYISVNTAPICDDNNKITSIIATFMDVTHRRKIIRQKDEFISVASHELRTPVTSLKASLQLLDRMKTNPDTELVPVLIDQANKSLNKVSVLIEDLLNSTKMTEGQLHLNKTRFRLGPIVEELQQQVFATSAHIILFEDKLQQDLYADADKIDQVIINLVNNAVKYGASSKEISIHLRRENNHAKVSVIDKGPGIPAEKLPYLFDRYFRVDLNGMQYSGLGLGLYICAQIVKRHDGEIGVSSVEGEGSEFWFTIPLENEAGKTNN